VKKIDRSLKYSFADIAGEYDAIRPGYPIELYKILATHCKLNSSGTKALEIGCGTGQATVDLVKYVGDLLCIDLGDDQIRIAKKALENHSNVTFRPLAFENLDFGKQQFDLVFCAQAFHWLDPERRFEQTSQLLKHNGHLALVWNIDSCINAPLQERIDILYQEIVPSEPDYTERQAMFTKDVEYTKEQMAECGFYANVSGCTYDNPITYDVNNYIRLISTYAYFRALESVVRNKLLNAIAKAVDNAGGKITVFHKTHLIVGMRV